MKAKSESEFAQSCPTLSDPMDCSPPGSSIREIFQARVLEWGVIAFSPVRMTITKKSTNAGEDVEKRESSYAVDGKVNRYNHDGEWCGASLKI